MRIEIDDRPKIEDAFCTGRRADGHIVSVIPLTFGRARITIGTDYETYYDSW